MTRVSERLSQDRIIAVEILRGPDHMAMIRFVTGSCPCFTLRGKTATLRLRLGKQCFYSG